MRTRRFLTRGGLLALLLFVLQVGLAQPPGDEFNKLRQDIESLKVGKKAISKELWRSRRIIMTKHILAHSGPRRRQEASAIPLLSRTKFFEGF